jgi:hypothetical protein
LWIPLTVSTALFQPLHCINHIVSTTLFQPHCFNHIVSTTLFQPHCFNHTVSTTLFQPHCFNHIVSTTLFQPHCFNHIVSTTLFQPHCFNHTVSTTLFQPHCFNHTVSTTLFQPHCFNHIPTDPPSTASGGGDRFLLHSVYTIALFERRIGPTAHCASIQTTPSCVAQIMEIPSDSECTAFDAIGTKTPRTRYWEEELVGSTLRGESGRGMDARESIGRVGEICRGLWVVGCGSGWFF